MFARNLISFCNCVTTLSKVTINAMFAWMCFESCKNKAEEMSCEQHWHFFNSCDIATDMSLQSIVILIAGGVHLTAASIAALTKKYAEKQKDNHLTIDEPKRFIYQEIAKDPPWTLYDTLTTGSFLLLMLGATGSAFPQQLASANLFIDTITLYGCTVMLQFPGSMRNAWKDKVSEKNKLFGSTNLPFALAVISNTGSFIYGGFIFSKIVVFTNSPEIVDKIFNGSAAAFFAGNSLIKTVEFIQNAKPLVQYTFFRLKHCCGEESRQPINYTV